MKRYRGHRWGTGLLLVGQLLGANGPAFSGAPGTRPAHPEATNSDTLSPPDEKGLEKIYEIGAAWHEHYQAAEAERNDVSLTAPHRVEITPSVLKVTENASNRLPGVEVKAGVAWVPYKGQTTNVFWEFQVGGGKGGAGSISKTGVPSAAEWAQWYPDRGPYTHSGEFSNDHKKFTFDAVAEGEAFNEGINTVKVKVWGWTRIYLNMWNPANWWGSPVETKAFDETVSQEKDVEVGLPFQVWKSPNLDMVEKPHPASLTVQLWDKNLAREPFKGNIQNYYEPKVRVTCDDGTIPPDDGTSNSEKMVCADTRVHTGPHPPVRIHVLPDFDPISVIIKHQVWDLPENQGKIYLRPRTLRPTELWCVEPGVPDSVPNTPTPDGGDVPTPSQNPRRTVVTPAPRIMDPVAGPQSPEDQVRLELISHTLGAPAETLWVDGMLPHWILPEMLHSGDLAELRWSCRDIFGRSFTTSQMVNVPPPGDLLSPDSVFVPQPLLQLVNQEQEPGPLHAVDFVCVDLAGAVFNEMRPVANVTLMDLANGQTHHTDAQGRAQELVAHGAQMQLRVFDPGQRYLPLLLPDSPPVLRPLTIRTTPDPAGFQDDRIYVWLSPSFMSGHLALGSGRIRHANGAYTASVGAVSDLDPSVIASAGFEYLDGTPLAPAQVAPWGNSDRRGLGYVPALFSLEDGALTPTSVQRLRSDGAVRLRVQSLQAAESAIEIPITYVEDTTDAPEPPSDAVTSVLLFAPAPNPMVDGTTIRFQLPRPTSIRLAIFDVQGREVAELAAGSKSAGAHEVRWNCRDASGASVSSGAYFIRLRTAENVRAQRLLVLR